MRCLSRVCVLFCEHGRAGAVQRLLHCSALCKDPADVGHAPRPHPQEERDLTECTDPSVSSSPGTGSVLTEESGGPKRKVSLSLPTIFLPHKLQAALEKALAGST